MTNSFYNPSGNPGTGSQGLSAIVRAEFQAIGAAFDHMPQIITTGAFTTVFNQVGNFTFTLPSLPGTLVTASNVTASISTETGRATAAEAALATAVTNETSARTAAVTAEASARTTADTTETTARIIADAAETTRALAAEARNTGRNRLHNGAMEISQRGTSFTVASTTAYTLDRWLVKANSFTATCAQFAGAGLNSRMVMRITGTVPAGGVVAASQRIESADCYDLVGQQVTLSFNMNSSVTLGTMSWVAQIFAATAQDNWAGSTLIGSVAFVPTGGAATFALTFPALVSQATNGLWVVIQGTQASATGSLGLNMTSAQFEAGAVATPFERKSIGSEISACQRFYETGQCIINGYGITGAGAGQTLSFTGPMRAVPTVTTTTTTNANVSGYTATALNTNACWFNGTVTGTGAWTLNVTYTASADL